MALVVVAVALTFVPMHWVHPMRVVALRPVTFAATAAWSIAAVSTVWHGFPAGISAQAVLSGVACYAFVLSIWLSRKSSARKSSE